MPQTCAVPGVVVITGAGSGIGQATAKAFAEAGCGHLALLDVNTGGLETTESEVIALSSNTTVKRYPCDVSSEESVQSAYDSIQSDFGRIDYSIHCAGIGIGGATVELTAGDFDRQIAVNLRGVFLCSRAALLCMKKQQLDCEVYPEAKIPPFRAQRGAIVNVASAAAFMSGSALPSYAASKAGVMALSRTDALDYAADRIRVNSIAPGIVDTPMTQGVFRAGLEGDPVQKHTPMRRFAQPEEMADVILFLASNKASYVTGATYLVDGGFTIA